MHGLPQIYSGQQQCENYLKVRIKYNTSHCQTKTVSTWHPRSFLSGYRCVGLEHFETQHGKSCLRLRIPCYFSIVLY
jgi:hypothetical protein